MSTDAVMAAQIVPEDFLAPARLWLLAAVAALGVLYLLLQRRRRAYAVRFTNLDLLDKIAPERPGWRRHLPAAAFLFALAALVVGLARPTQVTSVPRERATIMLAIDTSRSMQADDVSPTRFDSAKQAATTFVEELPDTINVGLVAFNGVASVRVPPTTNHDAVIGSIASMQLGDATAIGEAIFACLDTLAQLADEAGDPPPAAIVVMSDGETTVGRPNEDAVAAAQQAGLRVSTIAFGTDDGIIFLPDQPAPIAVPVNGPELEAIADATGGEFFEAASTAELTNVYRDIGSSFSTESVADEITPSWLALGLGLLGVAGLLSLLWFSRLP
jgi:Ca-activated chloride channel family protein